MSLAAIIISGGAIGLSLLNLYWMRQTVREEREASRARPGPS